MSVSTVSSLRLFRISLVLFFLSPPVILMLKRAGSADDEFAFVKHYGSEYDEIEGIQCCDDSEEGGAWKFAQDISYNIHQLKYISTQVHKNVFNRSEHVTTAVVTRRELQFFHYPDYKPMKIDIIRYTIFEHHVRPEDKVALYHFTKGLWSDSVHFLEPKDEDNDKILYIRQHVRGIKFDPQC